MIWIDLTDEIFRWSDGYVTTWANWSHAEPNGAEGENCAFRSATGVWFDAPCDNQYHFYCEQDGKSATDSLTLGLEGNNLHNQCKRMNHNIIKFL